MVLEKFLLLLQHRKYSNIFIMGKLSIKILLFCLMFGMIPVYAQKRASTAKKSSAKAVSSNARTHTFEGVLMYRNYEHHSAIVRKFSGGQAYNGERSIRVTLRGNSVHIVDESMHIHTIIKPDEDKYYIFSDVSKQGFVAKASEILPKFFSGLDPNVEASGSTPKSSTLKSTSRQETYKGDRCKVYEGQLAVEESFLNDVEMWYSDRLLANKSYRYVFSGLPVPGIVRKGIITQSGKIPLLGNMKSTTATELVALTERKVAPSEMTPPSNITIAPYTKDTRLYSFYKQSSKALKKAKLYPEKMNTKEVDYAIRSNWDFADEWLTKQYGTVDPSMSWARVGENLFSAAASISSLGGSKTEKVTATLRGAQALIGGGDISDDGGYEGASAATRTRGAGGSNSQIKAYERKMDELNQRYMSLTKQYNAIGQRGKAIAYEKDAEFARQVNTKNPTGRKGRVTIQPPRAGQGMGRKVESAIKTGREARAAENKAGRDREPVAAEIAQVAAEMAQLEQSIYDARVQANLFDNVDQRISSANTAVRNFGVWNDHLDKLFRATKSSYAQDIAEKKAKIARLSRDMNDDIRRLQGMSEAEIREINARLREKVAKGREQEREYRKGVLKRAAKMSSYEQSNHKTYMKYLSELKAMENGTQPYDKQKAREMQEWMKGAADRYEKKTGESYPGRDNSWEDWTPFGK